MEATFFIQYKKIVQRIQETRPLALNVIQELCINLKLTYNKQCNIQTLGLSMDLKRKSMLIP